MSEWTERLLAQYTSKEIQQQAASLGLKNVKKFTKAELADQIEATLDAKAADEDHLHVNDADNDTDKIEENDMNQDETPIMTDADTDAAIAELEALLTPVTDEPAEAGGIPFDSDDIPEIDDAVVEFTTTEIEAILDENAPSEDTLVPDPELALSTTLEESLADVPGENDTEAAVKITPEYHAMLDEVRANAAKRKHPLWTEIIATAEDGPLAQIAGKANTVRGILWKIGKHLAPMIEAYDAALVPADEEPTVETAEEIPA